MTARRLPGAVDMVRKLKRAGSPGHALSAQNARRLARPGHGTSTTILARPPGRGMSITSITTTLAHPGACGAWRAAASPLGLVVGVFLLALVGADQAGRV